MAALLNTVPFCFCFGASGVVLATGLPIPGGLAFLWRTLTNWARDLKFADILKPEIKLREISGPDSKKRELLFIGTGRKFYAPGIGAAADNDDAVRFKNSLKDMYRLHELVKADIPQTPAPVQLSIKCSSK